METSNVEGRPRSIIYTVKVNTFIFELVKLVHVAGAGNRVDKHRLDGLRDQLVVLRLMRI